MVEADYWSFAFPPSLAPLLSSAGLFVRRSERGGRDSGKWRKCSGIRRCLSTTRQSDLSVERREAARVCQQPHGGVSAALHSRGGDISSIASDLDLALVTYLSALRPSTCPTGLWSAWIIYTHVGRQKLNADTILPAPNNPARVAWMPVARQPKAEYVRYVFNFFKRQFCTAFGYVDQGTVS